MRCGSGWNGGGWRCALGLSGSDGRGNRPGRRRRFIGRRRAIDRATGKQTTTTCQQPQTYDEGYPESNREPPKPFYHAFLLLVRLVVVLCLQKIYTIAPIMSKLGPPVLVWLATPGPNASNCWGREPSVCGDQAVPIEGKVVF